MTGITAKRTQTDVVAEVQARFDALSKRLGPDNQEVVSMARKLVGWYTQNAGLEDPRAKTWDPANATDEALERAIGYYTKAAELAKDYLGTRTGLELSAAGHAYELVMWRTEGRQNPLLRDDIADTIRGYASALKIADGHGLEPSRLVSSAFMLVQVLKGIQDPRAYQVYAKYISGNHDVTNVLLGRARERYRSFKERAERHERAERAAFWNQRRD